MNYLLLGVIALCVTVQNIFKQKYDDRVKGGVLFFSGLCAFFAMLFFMVINRDWSYRAELLLPSFGFGLAYAMSSSCYGNGDDVGRFLVDEGGADSDEDFSPSRLVAWCFVRIDQRVDQRSRYAPERSEHARFGDVSRDFGRWNRFDLPLRDLDP